MTPIVAIDIIRTRAAGFEKRERERRMRGNMMQQLTEWERQAYLRGKQEARDVLAKALREIQNDLREQERILPPNQPKPKRIIRSRPLSGCKAKVLEILEQGGHMTRGEVLLAVGEKYASSSVDGALLYLKAQNLARNKDHKYYVIKYEEEEQLAS